MTLIEVIINMTCVDCLNVGHKISQETSKGRRILDPHSLFSDDVTVYFGAK